VVQLPPPMLNGVAVADATFEATALNEFNLDGGASAIAVDRDTGIITVTAANSLDFESQPFYLVHIQVSTPMGWFSSSEIRVDIQPVPCPTDTWSETGTHPCKRTTVTSTMTTATTATLEPDAKQSSGGGGGTNEENGEACGKGSWSVTGRAPCTIATPCGRAQVEVAAPTSTSDRDCGFNVKNAAGSTTDKKGAAASGGGAAGAAIGSILLAVAVAAVATIGYRKRQYHGNEYDVEDQRDGGSGVGKFKVSSESCSSAAMLTGGNPRDTLYDYVDNLPGGTGAGAAVAAGGGEVDDDQNLYALAGSLSENGTEEDGGGAGRPDTVFEEPTYAMAKHSVVPTTVAGNIRRSTAFEEPTYAMAGSNVISATTRVARPSGDSIYELANALETSAAAVSVKTATATTAAGDGGDSPTYALAGTNGMLMHDPPVVYELGTATPSLTITCGDDATDAMEVGQNAEGELQVSEDPFPAGSQMSVFEIHEFANRRSLVSVRLSNPLYVADA